jgi:hypothetical protein
MPQNSTRRSGAMTSETVLPAADRICSRVGFQSSRGSLCLVLCSLLSLLTVALVLSQERVEKTAELKAQSTKYKALSTKLELSLLNGEMHLLCCAALGNAIDERNLEHVTARGQAFERDVGAVKKLTELLHSVGGNSF